MRRIFIAADIDQDIREIIYKFCNKHFSYSDSIRLIPEENLHITLKFIGNIENTEIINIKEIIKKIISRFECFRYCLEDNIDAFPDKRRSRIIFIGIKEGKNKFMDLQKSIENGLEGLKVIRDTRIFNPHITIARIRPFLNIEEINNSIVHHIYSDMLKCISISLYESISEPDGVKYINIERFSLK